MFLEPKRYSPDAGGWIEVICGSMFSGKTEELIRRLRRARIANQKVEIFKPLLDKRYDETNIVSHDSNSILSTPVEASANIMLMADNVEVIGIDEAQFFDQALPWVCEQLALKGARVIVAGLDMDYLGKPFGPMPAIMSIAEYVTKVHAICQVCGDLASHSFRKTGGTSLFMLGEKESYEPRCRRCFLKGQKEKGI
jgi:thymidine kinase